MDYEQRLVLVESDLKDAKERISRHSNRINTLEQTMLEEKGKLTELRSEVALLGTRIGTIQKEQEKMNEKLDETNAKLEETSKKVSKYVVRFGLICVGILIAIFVKDSTTGAQIGSILAILKP